MNCPSGYIEMNGQCEYNYLPGDANLDGTPNSSSDQGGNSGFWSQVGDAVSQYGPLILIGAGTFWQSKQGGNQQPTNSNTQPPAPQPAKTGMPLWGWAAIGVGVLVLIVLLVRKK